MNMFRLLLIFLLVFIMGQVPGKASAQPLPPTDKAAHFAVSSLGVATTLRLSQWLHPQRKITATARFLASSFLLSLGVAKEIQDAKKQGNAIDAGDMAANVTGVVYGNFLMIEF